jgi:hypothetical protein
VLGAVGGQIRAEGLGEQVGQADRRGLDQVGLGPEVVLLRALAQARKLGDAAGRRGRVTVDDEALDRGVQQRRTALRTAWRRLPRRLMLEPLAYNRYEYERLRDSYQSLLLESFAPQDQPAT